MPDEEIKPEKRFWGDKHKAEKKARSINSKNKNNRIQVFKFGGLYFMGTKEEYKEL